MATTENMSIKQEGDETVIRIKHPKGTKYPPSGGMVKVNADGSPKAFTLTVATTGGFSLLNNGMKLSLNLQQPITPAEQSKLRDELLPEAEEEAVVI